MEKQTGEKNTFEALTPLVVTRTGSIDSVRRSKSTKRWAKRLLGFSFAIGFVDNQIYTECHQTFLFNIDALTVEMNSQCHGWMVMYDTEHGFPSISF